MQSSSFIYGNVRLYALVFWQIGSELRGVDEMPKSKKKLVSRLEITHSDGDDFAQMTQTAAMKPGSYRLMELQLTYKWWDKN